MHVVKFTATTAHNQPMNSKLHFIETRNDSAQCLQNVCGDLVYSKLPSQIHIYQNDQQNASNFNCRCYVRDEM